MQIKFRVQVTDDGTLPTVYYAVSDLAHIRKRKYGRAARMSSLLRRGWAQTHERYNFDVKASHSS